MTVSEKAGDVDGAMAVDVFDDGTLGPSLTRSMGGARSPEEDVPSATLQDYLSAIARHRIAAIVTAIVVSLLAAAVVQFMPRVYSCHPAVLQVVANTSRLSTLNDMLETNAISQPYFETQLSLVTLAPILRKAQSRVLDGNSMTYQDFADAVRIKPEMRSFLIRISFQSDNPQRNAEAANAIAEAYLELVAEQRQERTMRASKAFGGQRAVLAKKLADADEAIADFRDANNVTDVVAELSRVNSRLGAAESSHDGKRLERLALQERAAEVQAAREAGNLALVREVKQDLGYQRIQRSIRSAEEQRFQVLAEFAEDSPQVQVWDRLIVGLTTELDAYAEAVASQIEANFEAARKIENELKSLVEIRSREQGRLGKLLIELSRLETTRQRALDEYESLASQVTAIQGASNYETETAVLWERAQPDLEPVRPKPMRDFPLAVLAGIGAGLAMAIILDARDSRIHTAAVARRVIPLPSLGLIPQVPAAEGEAGLASLERPRSETAEAFRIVRNAVFHTSPGRPDPLAILVTSAAKGEGKTTVATNLAVATARAGQRTLLIDCDLRSPRVHEILGVDNSTGLSDLFRSGTRAVGRIAIEGLPQLEVMPAGAALDSPSEALGSERMRAFLEAARKDYDRVIIDAPPAGPVSDPAMLAHRVDGVVLVAKCGHSDRRTIERALAHLVSVEAPVLGFVFNCAPTDPGYHTYYA